MDKLGVIVPYRNRTEHLEEFLPAIETYLSRKGIEYVVIVVEQDDGKAFNRGMLCNIGFKEAKKHRCNYVVFHDVDMIPMNVDYSFSEHPIHLATDELPFDSYFGGITIFPTEVFSRINGFSNRYWGWGYEDDDLLYRCTVKEVPLVHKEVKVKSIEEDSVVFNGINSFAKLSNTINVNRDFKIKTKIVLGDLIYNENKEVDIFPIFNIKGYDLELAFTSFNRLILKVFDSKTKFYQIYTDITKEKEFDIEVSYTAKTTTIELKVNGEEIGEEKLDNTIFNYNSVKSIFVGTDSDLENFYSGVIKTFIIEDEAGQSVTELNSTKIEHYKLVDQTLNDNNAMLFNTSIEKPKLPSKVDIYSPYRRKSTIHRLKHPSNGFNGGRWGSDLTRWNELKFVNEVAKGTANIDNDGLYDLTFTLHSRKKSDDRKIITLNIGL